MTTYIPITEIHGNKINSELHDIDDQLKIFEDDCIKIYQLQSQKDSDQSSIIPVGIMAEVSDVLITHFDLFDKYKCYFVSKIYDVQGLKIVENIAMFHFVSVIIQDNNSSVIAKLCYNFHTDVHLQNNKSITDYISKTDNLINLNGHFSTTFHFKEDEKDKYIQLDTTDTFCGHDQILEELTEWLLEKNVQEILNKLT